MRIVVDISESTYDRFVNGFANENDAGLIEKLFMEGIILPKGHGRLIDEHDVDREFGPYVSFSDLYEAEKNIPTIIEADI